MAITFLERKREPGKIGGLTLDLTLSESHDFTNETTDYPIEDGTIISDHIKRSPFTISVQGFITDSPIAFAEKFDNTFFGDVEEGNITELEEKTGNRVRGAFNELLLMLGETDSATVKVNPAKVQLVDVVTTLKVYSSMLLTRLSINRDPSDGEALKFSATFKPLKKAYKSTVTVPRIGGWNGSGGLSSTPLQDQATSEKDAGNKNPKKLKSMAKRLVDADLPGKISDKIGSLLGGGL
jgi:hypothetical protein